MKKLIIYICFTLISAVILSVNTFAAPLILSEAVILIDGDSGQVLFEKNMHKKMYPASITKVMTALIALERGNLQDIIIMSYDAAFSVGRDTSNIALGEDERLTLEQALYALAIESANDASNGIAELISGSMENFAEKMTERAAELGAFNTNFTNAHGLPDVEHYTTAYDIARIMAAAVKIPEFNEIFSTVVYQMPATNIQPEPRVFNRRNSLIEGPNQYGGVIAEKIGWTGAAGHTYIAAAKRSGRTLIAAVIKSPDPLSRWQDASALFDYGFNEFIPVSFTADEFRKEQYTIDYTDRDKISANLIPAEDFTCLIPKYLNKEDIEIEYIIDTENAAGKAVFSIKSDFTFTELGEVSLQIEFNALDIPINNNIIRNDEQETKSRITVIFQIIGWIVLGVLSLYIILFVRCKIIIRQRKKRKLDYYNAMYKR